MGAVEGGERAQPVISVAGELVALGPRSREVLTLAQRWINDLEVTRTLGGNLLPVTAEAEAAWYESASKLDERNASFTIYERATLRPIGGTDLRDINHRHGTAEFGIMIGEKDCWGKGYGTEATALMLDYGFTILGLHNILLRVFSYNQRGIRAYQRAGFREIGRRREAHRFGGRAYDVVMMDCLATDFQSPVLRRLLPDA